MRETNRSGGRQMGGYCWCTHGSPLYTSIAALVAIVSTSYLFSMPQCPCVLLAIVVYLFLFMFCEKYGGIFFFCLGRPTSQAARALRGAHTRARATLIVRSCRYAAGAGHQAGFLGTPMMFGLAFLNVNGSTSSIKERRKSTNAHPPLPSLSITTDRTLPAALPVEATIESPGSSMPPANAPPPPTDRSTGTNRFLTTPVWWVRAVSSCPK